MSGMKYNYYGTCHLLTWHLRGYNGNTLKRDWSSSQEQNTWNNKAQLTDPFSLICSKGEQAFFSNRHSKFSLKSKSFLFSPMDALYIWLGVH